MKKYNLVCIAPDGDHIIDAKDKTYEECVRAERDMGSRWFFYPFHVITNDSNVTVVDAFDDMEPFIGKRLKTLKKAIADGAFNHWLEV